MVNRWSAAIKRAAYKIGLLIAQRNLTEMLNGITAACAVVMLIYFCVTTKPADVKRGLTAEISAAVDRLQSKIDQNANSVELAAESSLKSARMNAESMNRLREQLHDLELVLIRLYQDQRLNDR